MLGTSAIALLLALGAPPPPSGELERVGVIVPDRDNFQYLAFWIARGGGLFRDEGLEVEIIVPRDPTDTPRAVAEGSAPFAILPTPAYVKLISRRAPIVLTSNLLANDPIDLVARPALLAARKISATTPLRERLLALKGLKIGIAPHPPVRLRALFRSVGLDAADVLEQVTLPGSLQVEAFQKGDVDLLYSHTPYLERALLEAGGVVLVRQTEGEVPELSGRQVHVVSATQAILKTRPELVARFARAIRRALALARSDREAALRAFSAEFPKLEQKSAALTLDLYVPALPRDPQVTVSGIERAHALFPTEGEIPQLSGIDLRAYVWSPPLEARDPPRRAR